MDLTVQNYRLSAHYGIKSAKQAGSIMLLAVVGQKPKEPPCFNPPYSGHNFCYYANLRICG
ncbi:hypothetical protein ACFO6W_22780 [Dysgonomonas termitidis]|uniref:Uncharacterized protein n=1 Tax=Dysgonomonas termitidis TaxID=1516126 RepID=A0ABV9L1Y8_9BACT